MILDNEFTGDMRVENEVASLVNARFKVSVLCLTHGEKPVREDFCGATIIRKPLTKFIKEKTKPFIDTPLDLYSRFWRKWIEAFIQEEKIDVLHAHDLYMLPAVLSYKEKAKSSIPIVADLHENYPAALENYQWSSTFPGNQIVSIPRWRKAEIRWLQQVDHVVTVIEEATERYLKLGLPENKISVVANYVNEDFFMLPKEEEVAEIRDRFKDEFVVSYVGGFDAHRGLEEVVAAIPMVRSAIPHIKLVLVGDGANRSSLEAMSEQLGVDDKISFEGWQLPAKIPAYLGASDVCLIPHVKTEHTDNTIPHKLFQYMLLGKPIITSDCAPLKRILQDSETGHAYPSGDSAALAELLKEMYAAPQQMALMGEKGKTSVLSTYNWEATAGNLVDLYNSLKKQ
ncbi:MAG: glycosyltransferase family 4 protein [Lewinella sp.]